MHGTQWRGATADTRGAPERRGVRGEVCAAGHVSFSAASSESAPSDLQAHSTLSLHSARLQLGREHLARRADGDEQPQREQRAVRGERRAAQALLGRKQVSREASK